jgi:hypothetical protein
MNFFTAASRVFFTLKNHLLGARCLLGGRSALHLIDGDHRLYSALPIIEPMFHQTIKAVNS